MIGRTPSYFIRRQTENDCSGVHMNLRKSLILPLDDVYPVPELVRGLTPFCLGV